MSEIQYKKMGDLEEGDVLVSSDGSETAITDAYDAHVPEKMYRLRFGNGEVVEASGNHLWYTVTTLDKQMHKDRIKRAKNSVIPKLTGRQLDWLKRMAAEDEETSPRVEASFVLEVLNIGPAAYDTSGNLSESDQDYVNQVLRILESIGPVEMLNQYIYDETSHSNYSTNASTRLYSLKLFCEQMLALVAEAIGEKSLHPYTLKVGKVRTTEQIMNTKDLGHDFPQSNPKSSSFFGRFKRR